MTSTSRAPTGIVGFALAQATLADRLALTVATGGRGLLPLFVIAAPIAAAITVVRLGQRRTLGFVRSPAFLSLVLPYLLALAILPMLGIALHAYPERTLMSVTDATTMLACLILGAAVAPALAAGTWSSWLLVAIGVQMAYALGQAAYLARLPGSELFEAAYQFDLASQALTGQLVQGRSTGLYVNPNELGLWGAMALLLALRLVRPPWRWMAVLMAGVTVWASQSRGALVALGVALAAEAVLALLRGRVRAGVALTATICLVLAASITAVAIMSLDASFALPDRMDSLARVVFGDPRSDQDLAARFDAWSAVDALSVAYPWGTFGSPELVLGASIDSQWFRAFAQGSLPFVAATFLVLFAALALRDTGYRRLLRPVALLIGIAAFTQMPLTYWVGTLYFVLLGAGLQASSVIALANREGAAEDRLPGDEASVEASFDRRPTPSGVLPATGNVLVQAVQPAARSAPDSTSRRPVSKSTSGCQPSAFSRPLLRREE